MKKYLCAVLAVMLLVLSCAPALAASASEVKDGSILYVKAPSGRLNVREGASQNTKVLYKLPNDSPVTVVGKVTNGYVQVEFKLYGRFATAYVAIEYLTTKKPSKINNDGAIPWDNGGSGGGSSTTTEETVKSLNFKSYKLIKNRVLLVTAKPSRPGGWSNLRWVPSKNAQLIDRVYAGETLTVIAEGRDWYQVQNEEGYIGFIIKKYTKITYDGDGSDLT